MNRRWIHPHPIPSEIDRCRRRQKWEYALEYAIWCGVCAIVAGLAGYGLERILDR